MDYHHPEADYPVIHANQERCLEHRAIPEEDHIRLYLRAEDTLVCEIMDQKTNHGRQIRQISDIWYRRIEDKNQDRVRPGDAFLVRTDTHERSYFCEPPVPLPVNWTPCPGTARQQWDERMRAYQTVNKDRKKEICTIVYDYLTVYMANGRWRRKMVAYEQGTPSPFPFEYYDTRAHNPYGMQ